MTESAGRRERLVPMMLFALVTAVAMWAVTPAPVGAFVDDGFYTVLARSLATGQGYRHLNVPGAPSATHFPPGYPALLALLWRVWPAFPDNVVLFRLANVLCTAVAAVGAYTLGRRRLGLGVRVSAAAAAAGALSVPSLLLTGMLLSEPLFLALLFPALLLAERAADAEPDAAVGAAGLRLTAAAGVLCAVLMLVRTIGAMLPAAAVGVLIVRRRPARAAALAAATAAVFAPWQIWASAQVGAAPGELGSMYGAYSGWLAGALRDRGFAFVTDVLGRNAASVERLLGDAFAAATGGALRGAAVAAVCALAVLGLFRAAAGGPGPELRWRRGPAPVTAVFVVLYLGIVALWPFDPSRFVWGLWQLLLPLAVSGVAALASWRPVARPAALLRGAALAASAVLALGAVSYYVRGYRGRWWGSVPRMAEATLVPLLRWVAARTAPDDVIITPGETTVYLYTQRRALPAEILTGRDYLGPRTDAEEAVMLRQLLARFQVRYVLVANDAGARAVNALRAQDPSALSFVEGLPGGGAVFAPAAR